MAMVVSVLEDRSPPTAKTHPLKKKSLTYGKMSVASCCFFYFWSGSFLWFAYFSRPINVSENRTISSPLTSDESFVRELAEGQLNCS